MSSDQYEAYIEEEYPSDEEPADLTHEEIQSSVFEFDPMFEFDADQYFDFTDTKALYFYSTSKPELGDGEWADAADWFAEPHEGHETEVYQYPAMIDVESVDDIDIGFGSYEMAGQFSAISLKTPKKAERIPVSLQSPTTPPQSSPSDSTSPSSSKRPYTALSPLSSNTHSPLKSGAQRVRIEPTASQTNASNDNKGVKRVVLSGPQRLLVSSPTSSNNESLGSSEKSLSRSSSRSALCASPQGRGTTPTTPDSSSSTRNRSGPSSPTTSKPKITSPTSKTLSQPQQRATAYSSSTTTSSRHVMQQPRYMDPSKPIHQTQAPVQSARTFVSRHHQGMVTRRAPDTSKAKKAAPPTIYASSTAQTCNMPSSTSSLAKTSVSSIPSAPAASSPSNIENGVVSESALLKQVDMLLTQHKQKQKVVYEPRRFGIKEIKDWELRSGFKWHDLSVEERQIANEQMDALRKQAALQSR